MTAAVHWLTADEAADVLSVDLPAVYQLVRAGALPAAQPGGVVLILAADVDQLLDAAPPVRLVRKTHPWRTLEVMQ